MRSEQPALAERRARLIVTAAAQRRALAANVEPWRRPLSIADRGIAAARFIRNHPVWTIGTAIAPAALRAAGVGVWMRRGFMALQIVRGLRERRSPIAIQGRD